MRIVAVVLCFSFYFNLLGQKSFEKAGSYLVSERWDSAYVEIKKTNILEDAQLFTRVLLNFAGYEDYSRFMVKCNFTNRRDIQNLVNFLDDRIVAPNSREKVNLEYVILKSNIVDLLANELELSDAVEYHDELQDYLSSIQNKNEDFERAQLYSQTFDALLGLIEKDVSKLKVAYERTNRAWELKDTLLYLNYSVVACHKFVYEQDLDGYLDFVFDAYHKTENYQSENQARLILIDRLLNGLLHARYPDKEFLEARIKELYDNPRIHPKSFYPMLSYIYLYYRFDENSVNSYVQRFGFKDYRDLVYYVRDKIAPILSNDDYINILIECSRVMHYRQEHLEAMELMHLAIMGTKESYSTDLAEALSDFKARGIERENDLIIQQEKDTRDLYLKAGIFIFILLIIAIVFAIAFLRRSNVLNFKNKENEALILEKDLLMKEIHHRVKNNFELVSALLELQSSEMESEEAKKKLFEGQARIQSLSLLHNKLYESNDSTLVDMQQYITELVGLMFKSADLEKRVKLDVQATNIDLDIDTITPLGLIINELITNSCKYAFRGDGHWGLQIHLTKIDEEYFLSYSETGIENSWEYNPESKKGLGMILIKNLVKQLHGRMELNFSGGAKFKIWFSDKVKRKTIE